MAQLKDLLVLGPSRFLGNIYGTLKGNADTATKATQDSDGNIITSKYVTVDTAQTISGSKTITADLLIGASGAGGRLKGDATDGGCNSVLIGNDAYLGDVNVGGIMGIKPYSSTGASSGISFRKGDGTEIGRFYADSTNLITTKSLVPSANNTLSLGTSGAAYTGVYSNLLVANNANSGTAGGIALYGTTPATYGIAMRNTSNSGTHGYVTDDWATYFYMYSNSASTPNRGWIFKDPRVGNVASINSSGDTWIRRLNVAGTSTSDTTAGNYFTTGGLEIRESGRVGNGQSAFAYAPRIGFHWSQRIAASLSFHSDGIFYLRKQDGVTRATLNANLNGNATRSQLLRNYYVDTSENANSGSRPDSANLATTGSGGLITFKATGTMTTGKPPADAHILHFYWDNTGGYDAQLAVRNSTPGLWTRGSNGGTWGNWVTHPHTNNTTGTVGSGTQPVWVDGGIIKNTTYTLSKSVPADAKFTDTNTTYTIATGDSNGQIKVTPSSGDAYNVSVKGLGSAAYTASTAYATSGHNHDNRYVYDKANTSGNMNTAATWRNAMGMINLSGTDTTINPNGQTGWHHFINMSYQTESTNMWQTQIANKAGTTDLWVRSRKGGTIVDGTAWEAPWTKILTASNYTNYTVTKTGAGASGTWGISISGNAATATNADTVDGYHASSLWRSDGATWNPGANVSLPASANGQEWSFDINRNGKTGCYWHVWDNSLSTMLKVTADDGLVTTPYGIRSNGTIITSGITSGNWTEGIRINDASNGWTSICLGGTAASGRSDATWSLHTYDKCFYLAHNGSNASSTGMLTSNSSGSWTLQNQLLVQSSANNSGNTLGHGVALFDDAEGGNIHIYSGNCDTTHGQKLNAGSHRWEIDAFNGNLRFFVWHAATNNYTMGPVINQSTGGISGAIWNDYAEYRQANVTEPGRCIVENGDDTLSLSTKRLQRGCEIISDTFGFDIGKTDKCQTPVAATGRVLAYPYEDREIFKKHIGWPVCSGPNGTVSIMTEEEEERYPSRIIGIISAVPDYEEWGTGNIKVNGRVWIRIK